MKERNILRQIPSIMVANFVFRGTQAKKFMFKMLIFLCIFAVVSQSYTSGCHEVYVILGNSALVKCEIPSFVADFVSVTSWVDNEGNEYFPSMMGIENISSHI